MYTVFPGEREAKSYTFRGSLLPNPLLPVPPLQSPAANCHWAGLQIQDLHQDSHSWHTQSTHSLILPHGGGDCCCYSRLCHWYWGCTGLRDVHGGRAPFGLVSSLSSSWGTGSGEPPDKADPGTSSMSHHSSSKRHQMLLCHFELWSWCHLGSPDL